MEYYEVVVVVDRNNSEQKRVRVSFRTAWSPPLPIVDALANRFPDVEISLEYFERGAEFAGGIAYVECKYIENGQARKSKWKTNEYRGIRGG